MQGVVVVVLTIAVKVLSLTFIPIPDSKTPTSVGATPPTPISMRSEEHTSELQSLMRISYAVFCLKKKNKNRKTTKYHNHTHNTTHKHIKNNKINHTRYHNN